MISRTEDARSRTDPSRPRGFFLIISRSGGSTPRANAGRPSVIRLSHRIWMGRSGLGRPSRMAANITMISPMLHDTRYCTDFLMLSKTTRPSRTAATIVAKLSSVRIMSAALLATSVPVMPMAAPMSARLSAGASFTPSPVMATTWPRRRQASTIRTLCSGATRAYTRTRSTIPSSSLSGIRDSSLPVTATAPPVMMPTSRAMARAVSL